MLGGDEVREPLHAACASGRALLQAAFVVRRPEEAPGPVHVDDGEGEAVREQAGRGQALLLPAPVSAGETGRLAAPFVAAAARSVIAERTLLSFTSIHKRAKLQLAEGVRRGVAREETAAQHDCGA